jgi:hypothetical protein
MPVNAVMNEVEFQYPEFDLSLGLGAKRAKRLLLDSGNLEARHETIRPSPSPGPNPSLSRWMT